MARRSRIKWRESDEQELRRVVKNFNAKIARVSNKDPSIAPYLPSKISVQEVRERIVTRQDLKKELNALQRFSRRGAEEIVTTGSEYDIKRTKWEFGETTIKARTLLAQRKRELNRIYSLPQTTRGQKTGQNVPTTDSEEINALKAFKYDYSKMSKQEYEMFVRKVTKQTSTTFREAKDQRMLDNYFKALNEVFGDTPRTRRLRERIEMMPFRQFMDIFYSDTEAKFDYIYDPQEVEVKLTNLESTYKVDEL